MKKIWLVTIGIMISAGPLMAQMTTTDVKTGSTFLGPVGGIGNSWVGYLPGNAAFKTSGYAGISLIELHNPHWGWGGQVTLSSEGYAVDYYGTTQTFRPLYLRVPVRAYYFFGKRTDCIRPNLYLGPSFAAKLGETNTVSNAYQDYYTAHNSSYFRTFDAGLDGGGGLDFRVANKTWIDLDLGYYQGFVDAVKDPGNTYNPNHDLDISLSLLFDIR